MEAPDRKIRFFYGVLLVAAVWGYLFFGLGSYGLLDNNEGLYAEVAREMNETKSFIIPLLDYVPYLEKPPLLYWLISFVYSWFGISEFTTRIIPVCAAVAMAAGLVVLGRKAGRARAGWMSALMLASSFGYILIARTLIFDVLLTCLLSYSLIFFFLRYQEGGRLYLRLSYAALALAVLAKGLVALLFFVLIVAIFAGLAKEKKPFVRHLFDPLGIALFLAIAAPWHILAMIRNKDFAWFYFINEHVMRFLGTRVPKDYHTGPIYFHLLRVPLILFPWAAFLPALFYKRRGEPFFRSDLERFLWVWFLVQLVVFSLSFSKGNYYMITGAPPLVFLLALRMEQLFSEQKSRFLGILSMSIVLAGLLLMATAYTRPDDSTTFLNAVGGFKKDYLHAFAILTVCSAAAAAFMFLKKYLYAVGVFALLSLPLLGYSMHMVKHAEPYCTKKSLSSFLQQNEKDAEVFLYRDYEELSSLPFYLKGRVTIIDSASKDLSYGIKYSRDDRRFVSGDVFRRFLKNHRVAVVVMKKRIEEFGSSGLAGLLVDVRLTGNVVLYKNYRSRGKGLLPKPNASSRGARRMTWRSRNIAYRLS
jgi:4-amino-4-deoxy-L-arabinose transferase-like glycosyltransferase